jgi:hypothetical protein
LIYSGFAKIHNKYKDKGLKWTIPASSPNRKTMFTPLLRSPNDELTGPCTGLRDYPSASKGPVKRRVRGSDVLPVDAELIISRQKSCYEPGEYSTPDPFEITIL